MKKEEINRIKWLYLARLASLTGTQILFFAMPLLIYRLTHSVVYTGMAFTLEWIARIISFPISGYCADRFGAKRVYVITDMLIAGLCLVAMVLILLFRDFSVFILIALAMMAGFLSEQGYVSAESLAPKLVEVKHYPKSQSILESIELLSLLFGPFIAALFIFYFKLEKLIVVAMLFYFLSGLTMLKIKVETYPIFSTRNFLHDMGMGFNIIMKDAYLIQLVLLAMLINILFGLMTGSAPVVVAGIYHKTDHFYAILNLAAGLFGVAVIVLFNFMLKFISIIKIGTYTFLLACFACIATGFTHSYTAYLLVYSFFYGINAMFSIFFRSERARIIPQDILGRTIGTIIFITFLLFPVSGMLISISQKVFGLQNLTMLLGILCFLLGMPLIKKIHAKNIRIES